MTRRVKLHDFWSYISEECQRAGLGPVGCDVHSLHPLHDAEGEAWFASGPWEHEQGPQGDER